MQHAQGRTTHNYRYLAFPVIIYYYMICLKVILGQVLVFLEGHRHNSNSQSFTSI